MTPWHIFIISAAVAIAAAGHIIFTRHERVAKKKRLVAAASVGLIASAVSVYGLAKMPLPYLLKLFETIGLLGVVTAWFYVMVLLAVHHSPASWERREAFMLRDKNVTFWTKFSAFIMACVFCLVLL